MRPRCHRAATGMPVLCRRLICVGQGGCYSGADDRINTLKRGGCPDQGCEEGPLYRRRSSYKRLLAATMEFMGISRVGNASCFLRKTPTTS